MLLILLIFDKLLYVIEYFIVFKKFKPDFTVKYDAKAQFVGEK